MPREGPAPPARLDAVVTDLQGRAVPDLKATDFTLEIDDKPRRIDGCEFRKDRPLRLAVILDDLSLTAEQLNGARRALRAFVSGLRNEDEMAILRASSGSGAHDRFTSDKGALERAIDRARYHPAAAERTAETLAAGALGVVRGALEGMRELPGRQGLLLVSAGLGSGRVTTRAAATVYGFDVVPPAGPALELGLAAVAKQSGGRVFDSGDLAGALARIAEDLRNYYLFTFDSADLPFDFVARAPKADKVSLRVSRADTIVRARAGALVEVEDGEPELGQLIDDDLVGEGVGAKMTALLSIDAMWQVELAIHVDARDVTFVKGLDGKYRATLDTATALFDQDGQSAKEAVRSFQVQLPEESFQRYHTYGFDYTVVLPVAREGSYQARALIRDAASGRIGSARQFVKVAEWKDGKLAMSSIVVRGEGEAGVSDPLESGTIRSFRAGRTIAYAYNLFNVAADAEKRSEIETKTELWRDGVKVYNTDARPLAFPPSETPGRRGLSGTLAVSADMVPGAYVLRIVVTDKLTKRAVSQTMDFEVRP
jgi:hypothetical protein